MEIVPISIKTSGLLAVLWPGGIFGGNCLPALKNVAKVVIEKMQWKYLRYSHSLKIFYFYHPTVFSGPTVVYKKSPLWCILKKEGLN